LINTFIMAIPPFATQSSVAFHALTQSNKELAEVVIGNERPMQRASILLAPIAFDFIS
jgi:hypothetical protein